MAGLCPVTEGKPGDGIFPALEYLRDDGAFGVGTDSNVRIDASAELCALEYSQRLSCQRRTMLAAPRSTGRRLFEGALLGGNRAAGTHAVGIAPGAPRDILSLDPDHPSLVGRTEDALLDSWIFAGGRSAIDCVGGAGHKIVVGGRHVQRDGIARRYRDVMRRVLLTMPG